MLNVLKNKLEYGYYFKIIYINDIVFYTKEKEFTISYTFINLPCRLVNFPNYRNTLN